MRFSLRAIMIVVILASVITGWYIHWRKANIGLEISVPTPIGELDCEVPAVLREYWSGAKVREHDRDFAWPTERIDQLRGDLSLYRQLVPSDEALLRTNKDELVQLARIVLSDERSKFKSAANAAWILNETGDVDAFSTFLNRVKQNRVEDKGKRWKLFDVFPARKLVADQEFLKTMKASVGKDTSFARRSERALFDSGLDRQPWIDRMKKEARQDPESDSPIQLLLNNAPSVEALELAEAFLFGPRERARSGYGDYYLMRTVFITDFSNDPELDEIADRMERKLAKVIQEIREQDAPDGGHLGWQLWKMVVFHGTDFSKDLFLETLESPELAHRHLDAVGALVRLGHGQECRSHIEKTVAQLPPEYPARHLNILNLHEQCCGRELSIKVCLKLAKDHSNLAAFTKLAMLFEDTNDPNVSELVLDQLFLEGKGKLAVKALRLLEQIGHPDLGSLWAKLPASTTSDPIVKFYQHWHTQGISRTGIVNWINQKLKPNRPISVDSILNKSKFLSSDHFLWRFLHEGFDSPHKFAMAAFAHSGSGDLAFGEDVYFSELIGHIADLGTTELGELKVSSCSTELINGRRNFRIVINGRLYEFSLAEPVDNYENRYDARAIVELLNAIAIRRRLKKRFFAFPTEWESGFCLVLFIEPQTVTQLETQFGLTPIEGCKYYLDH